MISLVYKLNMLNDRILLDEVIMATLRYVLFTDTIYIDIIYT